MAGFDLHTHTTFSDGTTTPEQNVRDAVELGLEGLGVTDHDTTASYGPATAAADGTGLEVVLGTEFSAELDGSSVHVLGYWIDPGYGPLVDELERLRNEREDRARAIVEKFHALGIEVAFARVQELAGEAPIGRPHLAQAVVETGAAPDTRTVFDRWLADGGPAYVEKHAVTPERAVELLVASGGVAVLAHPGLFGVPGEPGRGAPANDGRALGPGLADEVVERMAAGGLAGIEADHPDHTDEHRRRYRDLASGLGLEVTAGSDYHGAGKDNPLGRATTEREVVERLRTWRRA
ncbi:PHP domain-containing protein [Egicoccus halophilus]|uniref:Phosphatase n=1 Tax=Egicoccus halophilus TaxID=1670830 RepID=A0A8J3ACW0_9ACTN|nr:PHP domain-containing protein [Egicoccus halophilus]GGI08823.1 phosphatase [Egicoccus halophilus]